MNRLKKAFITGSSQGLGAEIATRFAKGGYHVYIHCASGREKAEAVLEGIRQRGGHGNLCPFDLTDAMAIENAFREIEDTGGIEVLVNNARLDPYTRRPETTEAEWLDRTMAINVRGPMLTTLAVWPGMVDRKSGAIVNVSSVWGNKAAPRKLMAYSMSKGALHAMTRSFALEGAPHGITVNTVAPGLILTENAAVRLTPHQLAAETAGVPLGRGASSREIADIIWNTAHSRFITGEIVHANGGVWMTP